MSLQQTHSCVYTYFDFSFLLSFWLKLSGIVFTLMYMSDKFLGTLRYLRQNRNVISSFTSIHTFNGAKMEKTSITFQQLKITWLKSGVVKVKKKKDFKKVQIFAEREQVVYTAGRVQSTVSVCVLLHKVILLNSAFTATFKKLFQQLYALIMARGCPLPFTLF